MATRHNPLMAMPTNAGGRRRRITILAFLSQNCVTGVVLGAYGALIPSIETRFATTRTSSSAGIGVVLLVLGLLSPLVGLLLRRVSIRATLVTGATLNSLGYFLLPTASTITAFLTICAAFIGTGTALVANIAPATLISNWYRKDRAKALGLINLPLFLMLVPPVAAMTVTASGLTTWFLCAGAIFALLTPLMLLVVDTPAQSDPEVPGAASAPVMDAAAGMEPLLRIPALLASPQFWLLTLGVGFATGVGNAFIAHAIPYANSKAFSIQSSSLLLTTFGAAGLAGNLALGWLADRTGAARTLGISAAGQGLLWWAMLYAGNFSMLVCIAAALGFFTTSIIPLHAAAVTELFGPRNVSSVMGFGYFIKLPFMFGAVPFAGLLYDLRGNYAWPFGAFGCGLFAAAAGFFLLSGLTSRASAPLVQARR